MPAKRKAVKRRRRYDATARRARALQGQRAIVDAAERLFVRDGFQGTTIAAIAAEAGVSAETIYKTFGGKTGLVRAIRERAWPVTDRCTPAAVERAAAGGARSHRIIEGWGRLTIEVAQVMPILQLVAAAAPGDPAMARLREELDVARLGRMRQNAARLARAGHLRDGLRARDAGDVLWACSSPELYDLMVGRRGWTPARYARFIADVMTAGLLPPKKAR
jgi:AcrR family transcriptional regulator